ncbi:MAG: alpha/beta hydrolase, partial [Patescibacteria group bacterium]
NAKYIEWKIWFDKIVPFIENGVIFIGHSLGGIFLAKYLSENKFPKKIRATMLVTAPHSEKFEHSVADFVLPKKLKQFEKQGGEIFLYYSQDDQVVPFSNMKSYQKDLPKAHTQIFKDRGHFRQEEFPEIIEQIKKL